MCKLLQRCLCRSKMFKHVQKCSKLLISELVVRKLVLISSNPTWLIIAPGRFRIPQNFFPWKSRWLRPTSVAFVASITQCLVRRREAHYWSRPPHNFPKLEKLSPPSKVPFTFQNCQFLQHSSQCCLNIVNSFGISDGSNYLRSLMFDCSKPKIEC